MMKRIIVTILALMGFSTDSFATRKLISMVEEQGIEGLKKLSRKDKLSFLYSGLKATERPRLSQIPKGYLLEDDPEYKEERLNERITVFSRKKEYDRENEKSGEGSDKGERDFALLTKDFTGKTVDRRTKVEDILNPLHLPICRVISHYTIADGIIMSFKGSGYRNSFNQVMTAGHNLTVEQEDIDLFLSKNNLKNKASKGHVFSKGNLTLEIFFALTDGKWLEKHFYKIRGTKTRRMENRDFGIIELPENRLKSLNAEVGHLPLKDAPKIADNKEISVIGYPGEKNHLYEHKGRLLSVSSQGGLRYDVDTTKGNSGSPVFEWMDINKENTKVIGTHTSYLKSLKINRGESMDEEIADFMISNLGL